MKMVSDGPNSSEYLSDFHIAPTYEECVEYLKAFKHRHNKKIIKCEAKNIRPKTNSRYNIFLAEHIYISE